MPNPFFTPADVTGNQTQGAGQTGVKAAKTIKSNANARQGSVGVHRLEGQSFSDLDFVIQI